MSDANQRHFLQKDLLEMDRLIDLSGDDPITGAALAKRRQSLAKELEASAPAAPARPRTVLFFAGPPVLGTQGIDAQFATSALHPFLEMVKTQYSAQKHGRVGARGPRRDEAEARLLLTGLPRGSFGLELSQPQAMDFVSSEQLSDVLVRLTEVIASAGQSDENFAVALDKIEPRVLPRLKDFLEVVATQNAYLQVQSGDLTIALDADHVAHACERVGAAKTSDKQVTIHGTFRGATLDSWRFDFRTTEGKTISGRIADEVSDAEVEGMLRLTNHPSRAVFKETTITTRDGAQRTRHELLMVSPAELPEHT
jgi:hypothetical protein